MSRESLRMNVSAEFSCNLSYKRQVHLTVLWVLTRPHHSLNLTARFPY